MNDAITRLNGTNWKTSTFWMLIEVHTLSLSSIFRADMGCCGPRSEPIRDRQLLEDRLPKVSDPSLCYSCFSNEQYTDMSSAFFLP